MLAWMTAYLFAPFSAVYYPMSALPQLAQVVAKYLPTTYIFEGMREILYQDKFSIEPIAISFGLNILYLSAALWFFIAMYQRSRNKGLSRLK